MECLRNLTDADWIKLFVLMCVSTRIKCGSSKVMGSGNYPGDWLIVQSFYQHGSHVRHPVLWTWERVLMIPYGAGALIG